MPASRSKQIALATDANEFHSLGPIPDGGFLEAVHVVFHGETAAQGVTAIFSLTQNRVAAAGDIQAGVRVIDEGDTIANGHPQLNFQIAAQAAQSYTLHPMLPIRGGPRWLSMNLIEVTGLSAARVFVEIIYRLPSEILALSQQPPGPPPIQPPSADIRTKASTSPD